MRLVISENDLAELAPHSVILDTSGYPRSKTPDGEWQLAGRTPVLAKVLVDGRPMLVLYDAADPRKSLREVETIALAAATVEGEWPTLLPYYDFLVCWNRQHSATPTFQLETP